VAPWQPAGCDVGLELSWSGPVLVCGTGLRQVSVNPLHTYELPKTRAEEGPFPRQEGERDPCLSFSAQMS
jgi:hypothetical protein